MTEGKVLLAYFPTHEIVVSSKGEELAIDYPDIADRALVEEAGRFVAHLVTNEPESLTRIREAEAWDQLEAAFDKWRRARGLA